MSTFSRPFIFVVAVLAAAPGSTRTANGTAAGTVVGTEMSTAPNFSSPVPSRRVRLQSIARTQQGFTADLEGGARASLTLDPRLQDAADDAIRGLRIPYGAAVVVSVPDGRVLALAGHSTVFPDFGPEELALRPWAPAASVFKVVSAVALVSEGGLSGQSRTCYHGGVSAVLADNLVDSPRRDRRCATLAYGIGKSQNAILAKLATNHLTPDALRRVAYAFGFGQPIPFDIPVGQSHIDVPDDDRLEFARAAAGFWHSTLSPLHGALLAAAVANHGEMPAPQIIERAIDTDGQPIDIPAAATRMVTTDAVAREVGRMMELTTQIGTARRSFNDRQGHPYLSVSVAGKTGTLSEQTPHGFLRYSWFVGYAPADAPRIAFAVALGTHASQRIKAASVGRRLVAEYLAGATEHEMSRVLATAATASRDPRPR
jgi:penicillin-binding protein A